MPFGKHIKENRQRINLSQVELGTELGVSSQAVSKWENDKAEPDSRAIRSMCRIFGISADELMGISVDNNVAPVEDDIKFAVFGDPNVTDAQFEEIKQFARFIRERDKK